MIAYLLFLEIESAAVGARFDMLPLHCTLVHWFWFDESKLDELSQSISRIVNSNAPILITAGDEATFTGNTTSGTVPVTVHKIRANSKLQKLHKLICSSLDDLGAQYSMPQYVKEGFVPHVTNQKTGKLVTGESHECMTVCLASADAPEYGNERKVIQRFDFNSSKKANV